MSYHEGPQGQKKKGTGLLIHPIYSKKVANPFKTMPILLEVGPYQEGLGPHFLIKVRGNI